MEIPFKQWFLIGLITFGFILVVAVYEIGRRLIYQALFRLLDLIVKDETDTEERQLSTRLALFLAILCFSVYSSFLLKLAGSGPTQQIVQGIVASTLKLILIICVGSNFLLCSIWHTESIVSHPPLMKSHLKGWCRLSKSGCCFWLDFFWPPLFWSKR